MQDGSVLSDLSEKWFWDVWRREIEQTHDIIHWLNKNHKENVQDFLQIIKPTADKRCSPPWLQKIMSENIWIGKGPRKL